MSTQAITTTTTKQAPEPDYDAIGCATSQREPEPLRMNGMVQGPDGKLAPVAPQYQRGNVGLAAAANPGKNDVVAKSAAQSTSQPADAVATPSREEKLLDMPVIGIFYGAGKLAHAALFTTTFEEFSGKQPASKTKNDNIVVAALKWTIGMPLMTLAFAVVATVARFQK